MSGTTHFPIATVERKVDEIVSGNNDGLGKLQELSDMLREVVPHYDWVGFYLSLPDERILVLGPFSGEPTEHTKIRFGTGICGQAAESKETFVVPDVSKESNYLACSIKVKSEIVVPILRQGRVIGEIDIDSHMVNPFTSADTLFLEGLSAQVAPLIPENFPD